MSSIHSFPSRQERMAAVSWQEQLDVATSEREVLAAVRDFVACLDPFEIVKLPSSCRPGKFVDAEDVTSFAFEIVRHHCEEQGVRELVHKLAAFFSAASIRLSKLAAAGTATNEGKLRSA